MPAVARVGDIVVGTCENDHPGPRDFTGVWITGSSDVTDDNLAVVRVGDTGVTDCGHSFVAIEGSPNHFANDMNVHLVGHVALVDGGGVGVTVTGSPTVSDCLQPGAFTGTVITPVEPGVFLVRSNKVYVNSAEARVALRRDEEQLTPGIASGNHEGDDPPTQLDAVPVSCDKFPAVIELQHMDWDVSRHFKLAHCKTLPVAQRGLTASQIACNWTALCVNLLDPIYDQFKFIKTPALNSGLRSMAYNNSIGSKATSDHLIGAAADISLGSVQANIAMFRWILRSGLPFSQLIFEGNWVHIAFNGRIKGNARVMYTFSGTSPIAAGPNGETLPPSLA